MNRAGNYMTVLAQAPKQDTDAFLVYLRRHNDVVEELEDWLVIKNIKYHTKAKPWYTAFFKGESVEAPYQFDALWYGLELTPEDWEWRIKSKEKQTVPGRFHIHIYKP